MVHSKKIAAEVTTTKFYEDGIHVSGVIHEVWEFMVPQFDIDTYEDQAIDAALSIACALAQDTTIYEGLPEGSRPYSIVYFVEWEEFTLPVRFIYSKEYKRYAMMIGDIATRDWKKIKTLRSR